MKTFSYTPRPVKLLNKSDDLVDTGFTGSIEIKMPNFIDRQELLKQRIDLGDDLVGIAKYAMERVGEHVGSITLNHPEWGEVKNLEELSFYEPGVAIIVDVLNVICKGWSLPPKT